MLTTREGLWGRLGCEDGGTLSRGYNKIGLHVRTRPQYNPCHQESNSSHSSAYIPEVVPVMVTLM